MRIKNRAVCCAALAMSISGSVSAQLSVSGNLTPDAALASQSITALNGTAQIALTGQRSASVVLSGTWVATVAAEISFDAGATWVPALFRLPTTGQPVATVAAAGPYSVVIMPGASHMRMRASAFTSGIITTLLRATQLADAAALTSSSGANITTAATTAVKASAGVLQRIVVGTSIASATIKLFNLTGASCTGTPVTGAAGVITLPATVGNPFTIDFIQAFPNGICVLTSAAVNINVIFD